MGAGNSWQRLLSDLGADIICAQESHHPLRYLASKHDPFAGVVHRLVPHGKWGSAILSRRHSLEPLEVAGFEGWVVGARVFGVEIGGEKQDLDVYSVHIPSPGPYERRVDQLIDFLGDQPAIHQRIVAGDFNITTAIRQTTETLKNTPGERRIQQRLRDELSLYNAWQAMNPDTHLPQTLRWARNKAAPYHCDGIFIDSRQLPSLREASVLDDAGWATLSDHNPVLVTLE